MTTATPEAATMAALDPGAYKPLSPLMRAAFIVIGTGALGLGILGAILPGMPATVFFLITIGCYARSSERLYRWLLTRTWLQKPLGVALSYRQTRAVPVRIKVFAQCVAWSSALYLIFGGRTLIAQYMGIALALSCTIAMALIKTLPSAAPVRWTDEPGWRKLGFGAAIGAAGGLVWGIGAAASWRFGSNIGLALAPAWAELAPVFAAGIGIGALGGIGYVALRRALPGNQWLRGIVFGVLACAATALVVYLADLMPARAPGGAMFATMLVAVFAAYGLVVSLGIGQLQKASPQS